MSSRRKFIRDIAAASLSVAALSNTYATPFARNVGLQLSTVSELLEKDVHRTLEQIAKVGYKEVECSKLPGMDAKQTMEALKNAGLKSPCSMILLKDVKDNLTTAATLQEVLLMGKKYVTMAWIPAKTLDDFKKTADKFNELGELFEKHKIYFCHHNHAFEFEKVDGQIPYDILLNETDPNLVHFEMDLYWVRKGGQNPVDYLKKYPGRFPLWHVKDMDSSPEKNIVEVGQGIIDFQEIFTYARHAGLEHYFVEQETPGPDKLKSIQISYDTVSRLKY